MLALRVSAQLSATASPQQLNLAAPAGSTKATAQAVTVAAQGGDFPFSASVRYTDGSSDWLSVTPSGGTTPATLTVSADASKLAGGTYFGQIAISVGRIGTYVNVMFTVGSGAGGGSLAADPTGLTFIAEAGVAMLSAQTVAVTNLKGQGPGVPFQVTVSSAGNWLVASPTSATTPATLEVVAFPSELSKGNYTGTIMLTPLGGGTPTIIPVTLATGGPLFGVTPMLRLSQTSLTFNYQLNTTAPSLQSVLVEAIGGYSPTFTATATASPWPWLQLTSASDPTPTFSVTALIPSEIGVLVNPAALPIGSYQGTVSVGASGLASAQLPVTLTVTNRPALNSTPSSVVLDDLSVETSQESLTISSTGNSSLAFTATPSAGASWLTVTPGTGATTAGSPQVVTVRANTNGLSAGTYTGSVDLSVQGDGLGISIPVRLNVTGSGAPTNMTLQVSPKSLSLAGVAGLPGPAQTVVVESSIPGAAQDFTAAASSSGGWLTVDAFSGTAPAKLTVTANPAAVAGPGSYDGSILVTSLLTGVQITIPVKFTVAAQAIAVTPASLSFVQQQRGVAPPPQTIQITSNVAASFTITPSAPWIRVSVTRGSTPSSPSVSVDPTGLASGKHAGSIQVSAASNQVTVDVTMDVLEPPGPTVSPAALTFTYQLGNPQAPVGQISIGSNAGSSVSFAATTGTDSGANWLAVTPSSGTTPATLVAKVNTAQLVPGEHTGVITVASADGAVRRTVAVGLTVSASTVSFQQLLHGAALSPTPVAPGQIVTLTGFGLGPAAGAVASPTAAGAFETTLAGTRVLFDGVPAPLLFVRTDQINAIAPYAIYGRLSTRIQVQSGTDYSLPIEAKVVDAAPGIFTVPSVGRGQAAALNADLTVNSMANPAQRGSVISIFATGEGQTDPPGQDGRVIVTDLRRPKLPVTATVGGRPADVLYAGSAPMLVSGVLQVNVRIPADTEPGTAPLEIRVGDAPTQSGVTIAVR